MSGKNRHRNHAIGIARMNGWRKSSRLAAEHEHDVTRLAKRDVPQQSSALRRKKVRFSEARELPLEFLPAFPEAKVHVLPVVEPRSSQLALVEREPERLHEMQHRAGGKTGAAGIAGVPVNLRVNEHDVERQD